MILVETPTGLSLLIYYYLQVLYAFVFAFSPT